MLRSTLIAAFATISTATISTDAFADGGHIANVGHGHDHFAIISAVAVVAIVGTIFIKNRFYS